MKGLDKYLTSQPDFSFDYWCEDVTEAMSQAFLEANEDWIMSNHGQCDKWLWELRNKHPNQAAAIIERAYKIYLSN
jgi:hypothetical protein